MKMTLTPNHLTAFRMVIAVIIPILLLARLSFPALIVSFILFTLAIITDWYDGHLARTQSMITNFGKIADPLADKLLILGLLFVFSFHHLYGYAWIVLIFIREIGITVLRFLALRKGWIVPAEKAGKYKVGVQITSIYLSFIYWGILRAHFPYASFFQALNLVGIFAANVITVYSGILLLKPLMDQHDS